jgi:hypothetical protein
MRAVGKPAGSDTAVPMMLERVLNLTSALASGDIASFSMSGALLDGEKWSFLITRLFAPLSR